MTSAIVKQLDKDPFTLQDRTAFELHFEGGTKVHGLVKGGAIKTLGYGDARLRTVPAAEWADLPVDVKLAISAAVPGLGGLSSSDLGPHTL